MVYVRKEARACPNVFKASSQSITKYNTTTSKQQISYLAQFNDSKIETPKALLPDPKWVSYIVNKFRQNREVIFSPNRPKQTQKVKIPKTNEISKWKKIVFHDSEKLPTLSLVLQLDQLGLCSILTLIGDCLCEEEEVFTDHVGCWIYALLCCLDDLIDSSMQASLRSIMKHLATIRASLKSPSDPLASETSLIISIISIHFKQGDV
eukprot:c14281_g1_i2.p1 GENE.c14281_g1_i2~~c14281_g1_i2.p1  ORF type:complete len:207 (+),score=50.05 c14281_g1_i2:89-709(+)